MAPVRRSSYQGPAIRAIDPWLRASPSHHKMPQLLSDQERARLAAISSIVRYKKGAEIYRAGDRADAVFNIISGVVKAYMHGPNEHISAFCFPEDLFGLSEEGSYISSAKALTPVTAYRIPVTALRQQLWSDAAMEFHVLAKVHHDFRQAERHAFLLASKRTLPKLARFLRMLEQRQANRGERATEIYLPMARSDIAEYVGDTPAAISRAFRTLTTRRILQSRNRRHVKIIDRAAFEKLANDVAQGKAPPQPIEGY